MPLKISRYKIALFLIPAVSALLCAASIWCYHESSAYSSIHTQSQGPAGERPAFSRGTSHAGSDFSENRRRTANEKKTPDSAQSRGRHSSSNGKAVPGFGGESTKAGMSDKLPLTVYSVLFFLLSAAGCLLSSRKKISVHFAGQRSWLWTLLGTGLFLKLAIAPWIIGHMDLSLFESWATHAANGLTSFYNSGFSDYPPLFVYILFIIGKIAAIPGAGGYEGLLIKIPSILADTATAYLLYRLAVKAFSKEVGLLLAAFYMFNPAIFINSTFWGQVDSFFTLIVVLTIVMLAENRAGWSAAFLAAAVMMKPQGIIFLPVLFFGLIRMKSVKAFWIAAASFLLTALVIVLPFSLRSSQGPVWIFKLFASTIGEYPYASVNAFNLFGLIGANFKPDASIWVMFSYHAWGMIFIVLTTLFSGWVYIKKRQSSAALAALILIDGVFVLASGMHERYLFPACALSLLAYIYLRDKRFLWLSAGFSLSVFMNTYKVYYDALGGIMTEPYSLTLFATSLLNVILFVYLIKTAWDLSTATNKNRGSKADRLPGTAAKS